MSTCSEVLGGAETNFLQLSMLNLRLVAASGVSALATAVKLCVPYIEQDVLIDSLTTF